MQLTPHIRAHHIFSQVLLLLLLCIPVINVHAAVGDILFSDDFESGSLTTTLGKWTVDSTGGGDAGVSANTANANSISGSRSMFTRWDPVSVTTQTINANVPGVSVSLWIRRGDDDFEPDSEDTDNGEDFDIEYFNGSSWMLLERFLGNGTNGQIYNRTYSLPSLALTNNLRLRFSQTNGNGSTGNGVIGYDYWHIDDLVVTETIANNPLIDYYTLDNSSWVDETGNSNGSSIGGVNSINTSPVVGGTPGTCSYADIPFNNDDDEYDAIDTGVDINSIGNQGTISFWYKSNERWDGGNEDRMLLDASTTSNGQKYFFLVLRDNSRLRFGLEDTNDGDYLLDTGNNSFPADEWVHIAITWDMPGDSMEIYVNGNLAVDSTPNTNGSLGDMATIYLGDNRSTYQASGSSGRSANGSIDEAYFYSEVRTRDQIRENRDATHPCAAVASTCGPIPSTYPVYSSGQDLDIGDDGDDNVRIDVGDGNGPVDVQQGDDNGTAIDVTGTVGDVITPSPALTLPTIEPSTFPSTGSLDVTIPDGDTQTFDSAVEASYDNIRVGDDATANFVGGGPFYIDQLRADDDTTINFNAGTYFIDQLEIHGNGTVTINVNGPVRLFIGDHFITVGSITDNLIINKAPNSGVVSNLIVFLYPNAEVDMDDVNLDFTGVFYGPQSGDIDIEETSTITGAIIGGGEIDLDDDVTIIYTPAVAAAVASITTCTVTFHHYEITHNGPGITCAPTSITITGHDSGNIPTAPAAGTVITLSLTATTTGPASWSGTGVTDLGNGTATYTFDGTQTSVTLNLHYPQTDNLLSINVTDGTYSESEDPNLIIGSSKLLFSAIPTQISGKPSNEGFNTSVLTVQAINAAEDDPTICVPAFPNPSSRTIEFGAKCTNLNTCQGLEATISAVPNIPTLNNAAATTYKNVGLTFGSNSVAPYVLTYPDAGEIQLYARYNIPLSNGNASGQYMYGNSLPFAVRPYTFRFSNINKAGTANPKGTANDGLLANGFVAAEDTFSATLSAIQWKTGDDANINGIADDGDNLTSNSVTRNFSTNTPITVSTSGAFSPATGTAGTLSGTTSINFTSVVDDSVTVANLSYNEVGSISLYAEVLNYLGAADADIIGISEEVGRFYPDHFALLPTNTITPSCGASFTYMGEPALGLDYELQAQGLLNGPTSNYDKSKGYKTGAIALHAENANDGTDLGSRLSNATLTPADNWATGNYTVATTTTSFARDATPDGPYQSLQLGLNVTSEQDNRKISNLDMNATTSDDCTTSANPCDAKAFGTTDVRFGRLNLTNSFGSELLPLSVPVRAEYFDGTNYILNTNDICTIRTDIPAAAPTWGDITLPTLSYSGSLTQGDTTPSIGGTVTGGLDTITLSAPGVGNDGSVTVNLASPIWLQFDWNGDTNYDNDPSATATFGIFHGNDATIYRRELY